MLIKLNLSKNYFKKSQILKVTSSNFVSQMRKLSREMVFPRSHSQFVIEGGPQFLVQGAYLLTTSPPQGMIWKYVCTDCQ